MKMMKRVLIMALAGTAAALLAGCPTEADDPEFLYAYISANSIRSPDEKIPVFMTSGITEAQMSTALAAIQDGYDMLDGGDKNDLAGKIKAIRVVSGESSWTIAGNQFIVSIGNSETVVAIKEIFVFDIIPLI
ncbi:MAG: hypothetical protein LBQ14_02265 [Treponema sp.]|jgi:hypothetical protein|nr:hypothetical protein [Treponema sp.]